ncbi:hypothetical protein GUITHDRAFT_135950 [Guillardia theta CCMP2712]|uniref:Uncharacterized protein n=1 Tax=Guillardia theta (strain CCMP2712) TaxID=905079 RepID=L1JL44_GUITC|nr:hypothetical protein GUITHDRAFT_135950 [Guillardia theta CCMP2712]EKX49241.1 hypothetical protein GUITHDRAFT_135950 [Guillardia theta CCMP2712]|eukprot:XP_005836221.1 hypothetical protein GUITHDRAFT_135950 [Guillardia theta CCMP2712]
MQRFCALLLLALAVAPASSFLLSSSSPQLRGSDSLPAACGRAKAGVCALSMQEDGQGKRTTGFKGLFDGIARELTADTRVVGEDGQPRLKATPAQIMVLLTAQFGIPIALVQIYKAVTAASGN